MAWLETREMTARPVSLVHLVLLEKPGLQDPPARGDPLDQPVLREDKERRDLRVRLEPRGLMVRLDLSDPRGPLVNPDPMACVESPALLVNKDFRVPLEWTDPLDLWDPLVSLV